jgi:hypothetical protein
VDPAQLVVTWSCCGGYFLISSLDGAITVSQRNVCMRNSREFNIRTCFSCDWTVLTGNGLISLTVISSHIWSLLFTAYLLSCHYSATANSIQLLCSQAHIRAGLTSRNSTLFYAAPASFETLLYNHLARTTQKTTSLLFTAPFHSNGSWSNVACVFVAAGMFTE